MRASGTRSFATTLLAVLACLSTACTTMRPIAVDTAGEQARRELKPGDTVHLVTRSGASRSFKITEVGATSLTGTTVKMLGVGSSDAWGTPVEIPYADIAQIEVRRVEALRTIALVAGLVLVDVAIASAKGGHARCCISASDVAR